MDDLPFLQGTANLGAGGVGMVNMGQTQTALFYTRSVHNPRKSAEVGRPFFDDKTFVRIAPPGERLNVVDREATGADARRWPTQWAQFQQSHEQVPEGTPIDILYPEKPAVAATLRACGVHTIEQCAEMSGNAIDNVGMGAQAWSNAAVDFLKKANAAVGITQHRKDLEERDREIKVLHQQIDMLKGEIQKLQNGNSLANINMADLQKLIQAASGRPQMPQQPLSHAFDPQTSQINGVNSDRNKPVRRRRERP